MRPGKLVKGWTRWLAVVPLLIAITSAVSIYFGFLSGSGILAERKIFFNSFAAMRQSFVFLMFLRLNIDLTNQDVLTIFLLF